MKRIWPHIGESVMVSLSFGGEHVLDVSGKVTKVNRRQTGWCPRSVFVEIDGAIGMWWGIDVVHFFGES